MTSIAPNPASHARAKETPETAVVAAPPTIALLAILSARLLKTPPAIPAVHPVSKVLVDVSILLSSFSISS